MRRSRFALLLSLLMASLAGVATATSPADGYGDSQCGYGMPNYGDDEMQYADDGDREDQSDPADEESGSFDEDEVRYSARSDSTVSTQDVNEEFDDDVDDDIDDDVDDEDGNSDDRDQLMDEFAGTGLPASSQELAISHWNRVPAPQEFLEAAEQTSDYQGCDMGLRGRNDGCPESNDDAQSVEPDDSTSTAEEAAEEAAQVSDRGGETTAWSEEDRSYGDGETAEDTDERYEYSDEEEMQSNMGSAGGEADAISADDDDSDPYQYQSDSFQRYGSEVSYQASDEYDDESEQQWDEESASPSEEEESFAGQSEASLEEQESATQSEGESAWQSEEEGDSAWQSEADGQEDLQGDYGQSSDEDEAEDTEAGGVRVIENPAYEWPMLRAWGSWAGRSLSLGRVFRSIAQQVSVVQWLAAGASGNSQRPAGDDGSSPAQFEF